MLPDNFGNRGEYAGAAIWGSSPPIDVDRNLVYIATGNLNSAPQNITDYQERQNDQTQVLLIRISVLSPTTTQIHSWPLIWTLETSSGSISSGEAGPGGLGGGGTWGAATDEKRVYTDIANSHARNFTLKPSTRNTTAGGWVAMDAKNGQILWSTGDPKNGTASGPVTVANGVLFGGSTYGEGAVYAMDAKRGGILWSYFSIISFSEKYSISLPLLGYTNFKESY
ncbi:hypothetical protein F3Y22_tig00110889pilonHSYRG00061 [Hibiscus syriacus]|uniref:Uncharacterized protein n=1 Tax=Hibiscus syriacus TaxID=106335 RepID=A0A6A2ZJ21_HIBSY|nr:hypothetical protein F3Y22_tig00110889pilonHSYRG00061 [Hibiscus syriacus]